MKHLVFVVMLCVLMSWSVYCDDATIKAMDKGEAFYKAGCMIARELFGTNTGAEFDRLGNLRPECDPKKVIPKTICAGVKKVAKEVNKVVTKYGERKVKEALEKHKNSKK